MIGHVVVPRDGTTAPLHGLHARAAQDDHRAALRDVIATRASTGEQAAADQLVAVSR